jgi:hypothetical protein
MASGTSRSWYNLVATRYITIVLIWCTWYIIGVYQVATHVFHWKDFCMIHWQLYNLPFKSVSTTKTISSVVFCLNANSRASRFALKSIFQDKLLTNHSAIEQYRLAEGLLQAVCRTPALELVPFGTYFGSPKSYCRISTRLTATCAAMAGRFPISINRLWFVEYVRWLQDRLPCLCEKHRCPVERVFVGCKHSAKFKPHPCQTIAFSSDLGQSLWTSNENWKGILDIINISFWRCVEVAVYEQTRRRKQLQ